MIFSLLLLMAAYSAISRTKGWDVGVVKFLMVSMYLAVGLNPFMVILKPSNSMVSLANLNF